MLFALSHKTPYSSSSPVCGATSCSCHVFSAVMDILGKWVQMCCLRPARPVSLQLSDSDEKTPSTVEQSPIQLSGNWLRYPRSDKESRQEGCQGEGVREGAEVGGTGVPIITLVPPGEGDKAVLLFQQGKVAIASPAKSPGRPCLPSFHSPTRSFTL